MSLVTAQRECEERRVRLRASMRAVLPEPTGLVGRGVSAVCDEDYGCGCEGKDWDELDESVDKSTGEWEWRHSDAPV